MPELAVTDGMPPPADLPRGECFMTSLYDEHHQLTGLRIDRADPRILISAEVLEAIDLSSRYPFAELDLTGCTGTVIGALLKIHGVNRRVIYRITEYVPRVNGYIGEWPD
jgi:hypothetical protein